MKRISTHHTTAKGIGPESKYCCPFNSRTIFDWLRRIRLPRVRRHTVSTRKTPGVWDSAKETVIFSGSMADTEFAPPENGASWDGTREEFVSVSAREAEIVLAARRLIATLNAARYLSKLQPVAVNDLLEDCRTCGICREIYNTGDEPEQAYLVGPCGHVVGRTCLSKWVMPEGRRPNKTCPLCRAVLFEDDTPDPTDTFDGVNRELRPATIIARLAGIIERLRNEARRDERLLDEYIRLLDMFDQEMDRLDRLELHNGLDEPEIEDERYALAFLDAISASTRALEVWDEIRAHRRGRARGGIARPPYIFSKYVLAFFRRYVHRSHVGSSATVSVGSSLRRLMGQLYDRLREEMERTAMPIVWTETGPPLGLLLDPVTIPLIETALERLVDIERQWYEADR